ncbi:MAG: hypothetical protein JW944_13510 [Deltaproteobacteria bacterium]|nr:hypothetical protein [Deltaproteobacteria bacterium]
MYFISILKLEKRRSGRDRRRPNNSDPYLHERRASGDRRTKDDRRISRGRRSGIYRIISEQQKEKLDGIINIREVEYRDLTTA